MTCGCGAKVYAKGKCRPCYMSARYRADKAKYSKHYTTNREQIRARKKLNAAHNRQRHRKWLGLPAPTRPESLVCECCGRSRIEMARALSLDHDHVTGKFRGWLCNRCNGAIGLLGDSIEGVALALAYLRRAQ